MSMLLCVKARVKARVYVQSHARARVNLNAFGIPLACAQWLHLNLDVSRLLYL